jgi:hypothetical protein
MTDWDLMTPGIGLTSIGIVGVGISLSGIAKTFIDGMHAVTLLTMFIGMIFLASSRTVFRLLEEPNLLHLSRLAS